MQTFTKIHYLLVCSISKKEVPFKRIEEAIYYINKNKNTLVKDCSDGLIYKIIKFYSKNYDKISKKETIKLTGEAKTLIYEITLQPKKV